MSSQRDIVQPSRIAARLVSLFTPPGETECVLGDLLEEFSHVASKSGGSFARRWYWRQTLKTIAHLFGAAFRTAPWIIAAAVVGGFLLRWFVSRLSDPAIGAGIDAVLHRYRVYEHPHAYVFWLTNGMLIIRLAENLIIGGFVALAAKGREMTATITLGLAGDMLAIHATLLWVAKTEDYGVLWTLLHTFVFSIAIVIAGAIVRTRRSAATTRPSAT